jgi:FixJ family two-component response regulator
MFGLTGTALARVVCRHRRDVAIVLLKDYNVAILTQGALDVGVSDLLTKPLQSHEIASTLARSVSRGLTPPASANSSGQAIRQAVAMTSAADNSTTRLHKHAK